MIGVDKNMERYKPRICNSKMLTSIEKRMGSGCLRHRQGTGAVDKTAFAGGMDNAYTGTLANDGN